jgi:hypothetical protein
MATIAGCGAPAWAETTYGSRSEAENQVRSRLRGLVAAGAPTSGGFEGGAGSGTAVEEMEMERQTVVAAESAGGWGGFDLDLGGGGPPPPSPWDAPPGSASVDPSAAARRQLTAEVQGAADERPRYAQNMTGAADESQPPTATDATSRQLLIYEAHLGLAVHHVVEVQDRFEAMARERGGFLRSRTDDSVVVRVPADEFEPFMEAIQELGDVVSRRVQVQDVSEEFHDVQQRIHTLEAMRARVEQLLSEADDVEDALAVQQHLERITVELEQLQGRLRYLSDRVAYSTITVHFAERSAASAPTFQLPFRWLHSLGLDSLLSL